MPVDIFQNITPEGLDDAIYNVRPERHSTTMVGAGIAVPMMQAQRHGNGKGRSKHIMEGDSEEEHKDLLYLDAPAENVFDNSIYDAKKQRHGPVGSGKHGYGKMSGGTFGYGLPMSKAAANGGYPKSGDSYTIPMKTLGMGGKKFGAGMCGGTFGYGKKMMARMHGMGAHHKHVHRHMSQSVKHIFTALEKAIHSGLRGAGHGRGRWADHVDGRGKAGDWIKKKAGQAWSGVKKGAKAVWNKVKEVGSAAVGPILKKAKEIALGWLKDQVKKFLPKGVEDIKSAASAMAEKCWAYVRNAVMSMMPEAAALIELVHKTVTSWLGKQAEKVMSGLMKGADRVAGAVGNAIKSGTKKLMAHTKTEEDNSGSVVSTQNPDAEDVVIERQSSSSSDGASPVEPPSVEEAHEHVADSLPEAP